MKIFVTGATGFIGRAFCLEAVRQGHRVLALTRNPNVANAPGVEIAGGSLAETPWAQVKRFKPEAVLHLAWTAEPGVYLNSPENDVWLEESKAWFQRLFDLGVPYVAGTGTCIEYAASVKPLNEEMSPLGPKHPYSKAKVALFEWLRDHAPQGWSWLRVFFPYGAGEHSNRLPSLVIRHLRKELPFLLNAPNSVRDYIEVSDAASAMLHILENQMTGAINVGTGDGVTISELAVRIARLMGVDEGLIRGAEHAPKDEMPLIVACAEKLKKTGWRQATLLDEGLGKLVASVAATGCN